MTGEKITLSHALESLRATHAAPNEDEEELPPPPEEDLWFGGTQQVPHIETFSPGAEKSS